MYVPTTEKVEVKNYPYGRLRTSMFFSIEFKPRRGFRAVRQSINPKTGQLNKPKKSTYSKICLLDNTDGFCTFHSFDFYEIEKMEKMTKLISDNWDLFTLEQKKYLYGISYRFISTTAASMMMYCNSQAEDIKPIIEEPKKLLIEGYRNPEKNLFKDFSIDYKALEATKEEGYQPFKVTYYRAK